MDKDTLRTNHMAQGLDPVTFVLLCLILKWLFFVCLFYPQVVLRQLEDWDYSGGCQELRRVWDFTLLAS